MCAKPTYEGEIDDVNMKPRGYGKLTYKNGEEYTGNWKNRKKRNSTKIYCQIT